VCDVVLRSGGDRSSGEGDEIKEAEVQVVVILRSVLKGDGGGACIVDESILEVITVTLLVTTALELTRRD